MAGGLRRHDVSSGMSLDGSMLSPSLSSHNTIEIEPEIEPDDDGLYMHDGASAGGTEGTEGDGGREGDGEHEGEEWGGDDDSRSHSSIGDRTSASQSGAASASGASLPSGASGPIGPNGPSGGPVESPTRASTRASTGKRDLSRTILPSEETAFKYVDLTLRGV